MGEAKAFGHGVNQRDQIRMTPDEVDAFLAETHTMSCATLNHDGTIHLVAMWYGFVDGCLALETKAKSQKVANLRRNPQITCLVEEGTAYEELRGVELVGRAEIVDDADVLRALGISVYERHFGKPVTPDAEPFLAQMLRNRVVVKIHPERVVTWDHRKLGLGG